LLISYCLKITVTKISPSPLYIIENKKQEAEMQGKLSRKFVLIGILSIIVLTLLAISAVPVLADTPPTTTTGTLIVITPAATTTTTTTATTTTKTATTGTDSAAAKNRPTVTGVNPDQARQGDTLTVTISGTKFTGATGVSFGRAIKVNSFTVTSDTAITANITIGLRSPAGSRFVGVATPSGKGVMKAAFTVEKNGPVITGISPNQAAQGATVDVTISGSNFTGATGVAFGRGIKVNSFSVTSDTSITANITIGPHSRVGARFVGVKNPSGRDALRAGFTVTKNESTPGPATTTPKPTTTTTTTPKT
jgi:large repetitive protein